MKFLTPEEATRDKNKEIIREILAEKYLVFSIAGLSIDEDLVNKKTEISCTLLVANLEDEEVQYDIKGTGKGVVDALFNALILKLVGDCHSLSNLRLEEFYINVDEEDLRKLRRKGRGTDAHVLTTLVINNGCGKLIPFRSRNHSVIAACVSGVCEIVEFFVNSERAVLHFKYLIDDAQRRNRGDLYQQYTYLLSSLVCNTSYEESLKKD